MNDTVMVTGGAGFTGSCYIRLSLRSDAARIVNVDKLTYAASPEALENLAEPARLRSVAADIGEADRIRDLLAAEQPRAVIHFAAETHVDRSIDDPHPFVQTNVLGTTVLLQCCLDYWQGLPASDRDRFRFLHVSTDEVYGSSPPGHEIAEDARFAPSSPYAATKAAAEHLCQSYYVTYGLPMLQTRSSNNFGPYQFPEKLIPLITLRAAAGQPLPIYGDGRQSRDWLFVEDHCAAIRTVLAAASPGSIYNVASGERQQNIDVVRQICELVDEQGHDLPPRPTSSLIQHVADRPGHDLCYAIDSTKLRQELGWQPAHSFRDALRATVRWYLENHAWVDRVSQRYRGTRLGQPESPR